MAWWWAAYRWAWALYHLGWWVPSLLHSGGGFDTPWEQKVFYFIYLTNWSYMVIVVSASVLLCTYTPRQRTLPFVFM